MQPTTPLNSPASTATPTASPSAASPSYHLEEWRKGYRSLNQEHEYGIEDIEGQIPPELQGTLFRNGPGLLDVNGQRIQHPFDGDGMVCAFSFKEGRAHFRNRFVKTQGYLEEQAAGKNLYRGVFGTQKLGGWLANLLDLRLKNIANTNIVYWGEKLLALWEAAEPHRLDPHTLDTIGLEYLDGVLEPGSAFAAHPRIDPNSALDDGTPCLVNFAVKPGLSTSITIYELNQAGQVIRQHSHAVPGFAFIHDFAITPNYCIFFQAPVSFNPLPYLLGFKGVGQCITVRTDQPTQAIFIPRHGSESVKIVPVKAGFIFHHANAFERDGKIVVDSICYKELPSVEPGEDYLTVKFENLAPGQLWRFEFDLTANQVNPQLVEPRCCEFPVVHPDRVGRANRYTYMGAAHEPTGNAPLQAILKIDWETGDRQLWSAAPHGFVSEPIFVPQPNYQTEDEGWLLTLVFNGQQERSELMILDAQELQPVARLKLKHHIPYGLHGNFTPHYFGE
jgi:all-trans-8'-apo-beta-carotenal 15,15'-oxygenase